MRRHEKDGKEHEMPCHHNLDDHLCFYIESAPLSGGKRWLFRSSTGRTKQFSDQPLRQADVYQMIGRSAGAAGIRTKVPHYTFRATGITEYLENGGRVKVAQQMTHHERTRTIRLY